jgi:protein-disulfide isomerase
VTLLRVCDPANLPYESLETSVQARFSRRRLGSSRKDGEMNTIDRRIFLLGSAAAALLAACPAALAQGVNVEELNAPGQLGEKVLGSPDAPVTVIEYASFSCPHCANFANNIFADFKLQYVDSGKVRFVFREFLRNGLDVAISAVARCAPADEYFDVVDAYFATQDEWMRADDLRQAIFEQAQPFGFTEASFDACLGNKTLLEALDAGMQRANSFGVTGTPTFFINGQKEVGALPMEQWEAIIEPMLASAGQ